MSRINLNDNIRIRAGMGQPLPIINLNDNKWLRDPNRPRAQGLRRPRLRDIDNEYIELLHPHPPPPAPPLPPPPPPPPPSAPSAPSQIVYVIDPRTMTWVPRNMDDFDTSGGIIDDGDDFESPPPPPPPLPPPNLPWGWWGLDDDDDFESPPTRRRRTLHSGWSSGVFV